MVTQQLGRSTTMPITAATTIHGLVEEFPYLKDWLIAYNSHFESLRNPVLFNTMARTATLGIAATMAGVPEDTLLDDIRMAVAQHQIVAEEAATGAAGAMATAPLDADESARRAQKLKEIIKRLHDGASVADVKAEFDALAQGVDSVEIARMEQALIAEGMPVEEVQRLYDVHVSVFKDTLDVAPETSVASDHPVDAYRRENEVATKLVADLNLALSELSTARSVDERAVVLTGISAKLEELTQIDTHYARKENQLFPVLEAHDVVGPTKVMWGLDDDIRGRIKSARAVAAAGDTASLIATLPETLTMIDDMVYKEEKILFPTALGVVADEEWATISAGDAEIGYAWVEGPAGETARAAAAEPVSDGGDLLLPLPTGALSLAELDLLFRALPFDVTYVDENDRVRFYSEGERVFPRSPGAIGREVRNCHPPKSLDKVEQILAEFKAGTKDEAEFWIEMGPKFVHIRYFALRDSDGTYKGCLEVVHDATHVRALSGNRRIVDW
jgi:DUF438 domain-containing protein